MRYTIEKRIPNHEATHLGDKLNEIVSQQMARALADALTPTITVEKKEPIYAPSPGSAFQSDNPGYDTVCTGRIIVLTTEQWSKMLRLMAEMVDSEEYTERRKIRDAIFYEAENS